jgi:anthrone oxygenase-like protein
MDVWAIVMLVAGGLFAGAVVNFAWSRLPIWRTMPPTDFVKDFDRTIAVADKVQPALLAVTIVGAIGFALSSNSTSRILAIAAAAGFVVTMVASLAILVPLQRKIIALGGESEAIEAMRSRWFQGHLGRSVLSVISLVLAASSVAA